MNTTHITQQDGDKKITHHKCWEVWKVWVDAETGSGHDAEAVWEQMVFDEKCKHRGLEDEQFDDYQSAVDYLQDIRIGSMSWQDYEKNKTMYRTQGVVIWYVEWGTYEDRTVAYDNWQQKYCEFAWWTDDYK